MHRSGHLGITLIIGAPILLALKLPLGIIIVGTMIVFTSLPDKDQKLDFLPGISHRGITHTILFGILCGAIMFYGAAYVTDFFWTDLVGILSADLIPPREQFAALVGIGAALGIFSHILGDVVTVGSKRYGVVITPYWPISKRIVRFGWCYANDKKWNLGFLTIGILFSGGALLYRLQLLMDQTSISIPF
jgi:inner membrane protein